MLLFFFFVVSIDYCCVFFFFKQKTAYEMRISDWSSDVCSSDLCFSDNTHNSHYYDQRGIMNVYLGTYGRVDGSIVKGPSLSDLVAAKDKAVDADMKAKLEAAEAAAAAMEIGRASGRERVCQSGYVSGGDGSSKKKKETKS